MDVRIASYEEWIEDPAVIECGPKYVAKPLSGRVYTIRPSIAFENFIHVTSDFLPIREDGTALLEGAMHSPELYLGKSGKPIHRNGHGIKASLGTVRKVDETCLVMGGSPNIYHWFVDHLPRLLMARKHIDIAGMPLLVNGPFARFQVETLDRAGITNPLIHIGEGESAYCETAWFPFLLATTTIPHPLVPQLVREALKPEGRPTRRIYLSRQDATSRRLVNEDELISLLLRYGFETHVAGNMSLDAQIDLFASASVVLAAHGAGMANMMFCSPGTTVLELSEPAHRVSSMFYLAKTCGLKPKFLTARQATEAREGNVLLSDWAADLAEVEQALAGL